MPLKVLVILLILGSAAAARKFKGCEIPITSKEREHIFLQWPLVFDIDGREIIAPDEPETGAVIWLPDGLEVILSCGPNYLKKFYKTEAVRATCKAETNKFIINTKGTNLVEGTELNIKDLTCDLRAIEEVQLNTLQGCEKPLTASSFGYLDPIRHNSVVLGDACYDTTAGKTLWAHINLGTSSERSILRVQNTWFFKSQQPSDSSYKLKLFRGLHFDELYERMRQQSRINKTPALVIRNYVDDLLIGNPQFQPIKKLGWNYFVADEELHVLKAVKQDIELFREQHNLEIYVGSHGVMSLDDGMGGKLSVYLHVATKDDQSFPVPGLVWLLVKERDMVIVFGIFNDAAISQQEVSQRGLCNSVCEKVTWLTATRKLTEVERRPLICCSYAEIAENVEEIPKLESISELLL